jgi:hypothetical protein
MRPILLTLCLSAISASADTFEVLGWSPDGAYVATLDHGVGEGSGFPWAKLRLYDTAKRKLAAEPTTVTLETPGATEAEAVRAAKKKAEGEKTRLRIREWVPGKQIAHDDKGELSEQSGAPIGTLKLTATKASKKQQARTCEDPFIAQRLKLVMYFLDDDKPFTVLDEKATPKDRACVGSCKLGPVFAQATAALFVVECQVQGFEGAATLSYPVAVKLPYGLDVELPKQ